MVAAAGRKDSTSLTLFLAVNRLKEEEQAAMATPLKESR